MYYLITVITLACVLLTNLFLSGPLQSALGIWGIAVTELLFGMLALGGGCVVVSIARKRHVEGIDILEIFSTRPATLRQCVGGILLMGSAMLTSTLYSNIVLALFPEAMEQTMKSLEGSLYNDSLTTMLVVSALFPAICEELVFRGLTQYSLEKESTPRIAILMTGLIFGLFHVNFVRIPITALLGIAMGYTCWRTGSILVPMLMHFCNNAFSVVVTRYSVTGASELTAESQTLLEASGVTKAALYCVSGAELFCLAAGLLLAGIALLEGNPFRRMREHKVTAGLMLALLVLLTGAYIIAMLFV